MGCTAVRITFVLGIALPDCPAVFAVRVPDLGAEDLTAIAADDFSGKGTVALGAAGACFAPSQFQLCFLPFSRLYDCLMAVFHIVLRNLALVDLPFLLQEIYCEFLLQECRSLIFFISEYAFQSGGML